MNTPPPTLLRSAALGSLLHIAAQTPDGCFVELGVYKGGTAWWLDLLAIRQGRELHLFDTFTGIPEKAGIDAQHNIGDFGDTCFDAVYYALSHGGGRPNAKTRFHVGVFPATAPKGFFPPIAFAHIDCDQYDATLSACQEFWPRMVPGGVMLFDDFNCTDGACTAVHEFFAGTQGLITTEGKVAMIKGGVGPIADMMRAPAALPPPPELPPM